MDEQEKVDTSTPKENDGLEKEPVDTTETAKKQVEEGLEDIDEVEKGDEPKTEPNEEEPKDKVEKTFTQTELNKIVEQRVARLETKHKKEMEELEQRYKQGDYSPELKNLQNELTAEKAKTADLQSQLAKIEIDNAFMKENVADEFKEFVEYKVLKMVTEEKDFATCLKEFKNEGENAKYFVKASTGGKSIVPPRPSNNSANNELLATEKALEKSMGL